MKQRITVIGLALVSSLALAGNIEPTWESLEKHCEVPLESKKVFHMDGTAVDRIAPAVVTVDFFNFLLFETGSLILADGAEQTPRNVRGLHEQERLVADKTVALFGEAVFKVGVGIVFGGARSGNLCPLPPSPQGATAGQVGPKRSLDMPTPRILYPKSKPLSVESEILTPRYSSA